MCVSSMQVAYRCFYTGKHNAHLYPTFSRASGSANPRYANIFEQLVYRFRFRTIRLLMDQRSPAIQDMASYIIASLNKSGPFGVDTIRAIDDKQKKQRNRLKQIKHEMEGEQAGL